VNLPPVFVQTEHHNSEPLGDDTAGFDHARDVQIPYLAVERQGVIDGSANGRELIHRLGSADRQMQSPGRTHRVELANSAEQPRSQAQQRAVIAREQTDGVIQQVDEVQSMFGPPRLGRKAREALTRKLKGKRPGTGKRKVGRNAQLPGPVSRDPELIDDRIGLANGQKDALERGAMSVRRAAHGPRSDHLVDGRARAFGQGEKGGGVEAVGLSGQVLAIGLETEDEVDGPSAGLKVEGIQVFVEESDRTLLGGRPAFTAEVADPLVRGQVLTASPNAGDLAGHPDLSAPCRA
jgi:hypothetical protein